MFRGEYLMCPVCGGLREHDLRTGLIGECWDCGFSTEDLAETWHEVIDKIIEEKNGDDLGKAT